MVACIVGECQWKGHRDAHEIATRRGASAEDLDYVAAWKGHRDAHEIATPQHASLGAFRRRTPWKGHRDAHEIATQTLGRRT